MKKVVGIVIAVGLVACAGPKPILYQNAHLERVGPEMAEQDIDDCRKMAEAAGATPGDKKGAKIAGSTAAGAGIGAAGGAVGGAVLGATSASFANSDRFNSCPVLAAAARMNRMNAISSPTLARSRTSRCK